MCKHFFSFQIWWTENNFQKNCCQITQYSPNIKTMQVKFCPYSARWWIPFSNTIEIDQQNFERVSVFVPDELTSIKSFHQPSHQSHPQKYLLQIHSGTGPRTPCTQYRSSSVGSKTKFPQHGIPHGSDPINEIKGVNGVSLKQQHLCTGSDRFIRPTALKRILKSKH